MKHAICFYVLGSLLSVAYIYADEQQAQFIKQVLVTEAQKILQQENEQLAAEISRAPRPDSPAISHPIYPVGPLQGPQGPQGKQGLAGKGLASCGPFKLLEAATAGDVVRLLPDTTNPTTAKAAIRKIRKGATFNWVTRAGGTLSTDADRANGVAVDSQGNLYVTGEFTGTITFGSNITLVSNTATVDAFVAKLNPTTGAWIWATRAGGDGSGEDIGHEIATDCQGNVYVIGEFDNTITFGNSITLVADNNATDVFVAKVNPTNGEWVWATRTGGNSSDRGRGIATDCQGNVYVTGNFRNTATFGSSITLVASGASADDIFVAKLNSATGEWTWATRAGVDALADIGNNVATDSQGNVYVTGEFQGTVTFGNNITLVSAGSTDIFVAKLNPANGEWVWATRAGTSGSDRGHSIATDCQGNVLVTGEFAGTATFGNNIMLITTGNDDMFVAKLNSATGEWIWATRAGSTSDDLGRGIATDYQGDVYVTGEFQGTVTFGNNIILNSGGGKDAFVAKLNGATQEWLWAARVGGTGTEIGQDITVDNRGNVYVVGEFSHTATAIPGNILLVSNALSTDLFVAKIFDAEHLIKTLGLLQESGAAGDSKNVLFPGILFSNIFTSLTPAADYYLDSNVTVTVCPDIGLRFIGTACSPTDLIVRDCC